MLLQAEQLASQGKFTEAAAMYDELTRKFPSSTLIADANFRAGYAYYNANNYDAALAAFKRVLDGKGASPEIMELALSLTPQVLVAKASRLPATDPNRNAALEDAVKQFDVYLGRYPNSDEVESANYSKALALYQLAKYDDAAAALRANMQRFAASPTVQDSQYLLALTMGTIGNVAMQKSPPDAKTADLNYDEAEKLLRDIITKRLNLALVNSSQFQIGELLFARGITDREKQTAVLNRAIDAYRAVLAKDYVLQAQQQRIDFYKKAQIEAGQRQDQATFQKLKRVVDKEQEKLAAFKERPDETTAAKIKTGLIFSTLERPDETRVLMSYLDQSGLVTEPDQKKLLLYHIARSYALQRIIDKAVEKYNAFQAAYKADPIAQDLPLLMGNMYLSNDPKINNPEQAKKYFAEAQQMYPDSKVGSAAVLMQAQGLIQQKKFDEALTILNDTLAKNPSKELALDAEFFRASLYGQTGKIAEAIEAFKKVRDTYPDTPQAEQSHFQVAQMLGTSNPKAATTELQSFIAKYPESTLLPAAIFTLGSVQAANGQKDVAMTTFKDLIAKYPKSDTAPYAYFERAKMLAAEQKFDDCLAIMREFIKSYPESPSLYHAYDFIAQILGNQNKGTEALAAYEEFIEKHPKDPNAAEALLKVSTQWKAYTESQGPYLAIDQAKRTEWHKGVDKSTAAAERILTDFPDSPAVALALNHLLELQRLQLAAKLKTSAEVEKYFENLAAKFEDKPGTKAKIIFTLAALTYDKDKAKAVQQMTSAYKPDLKFAPEDLDLYGLALIDAKKYDDALAVYEKLAKDYPLPSAGAGSRDVQEAQAISLAGIGKALQESGKKEAGGQKFAELEKLYSWSTKMLEVNYGIALDLHERKQDEEAMARLRKVALAQRAPPELRAKSMLLLGKIHEENKRYTEAIDNYVKISVYYGAIREVAAEGLWRGAQLLERQANGELPMPTPVPKGAPKN
jgi:TolA-binding protein